MYISIYARKNEYLHTLNNERVTIAEIRLNTIGKACTFISRGSRKRDWRLGNSFGTLEKEHMER